MNYQSIALSRLENGIVEIRLVRPEKRNAFDDALIAEMTDALEKLADDETCSVVWLTGEGACFSAGADLDWMRRVADQDRLANLEDAHKLANMLRCLDSLAKPTLALVNGPAIGGGVGLVAACDIAIAADTAFFQLAEVRLGIIPAVISPYVVQAIGERQARRYCLTAERIDAPHARHINLVHEVAAPEQLTAMAYSLAAELRKGGSKALGTAKRAVQTLRQMSDADTDAYTAELIADLRASDEGREGIRAFLEKRLATWHPDA